ncbi:MAG: hypothetical protein SF028_11000 [Candidatus Sumerlaeia bacterium]|nr:hypothetical protein [Candidatus Sumerlaeia bacterium]
MGFKDFLKKLGEAGQELTRDAKKDAPPADPMSSRAGLPPPPPARPDPQGVPPSGANRAVPPSQLPPSALPPMAGARGGDGIPGLKERRSGDAPDPLNVNSVDDSVYSMRASLVSEVEERYGRFGPRVSSYMLTHLMMPNGLAMLLQKLGLKSKGYEAGDREQVEHWIQRSGADAFCVAVGISGKASGAPRPAAEDSSQDPRVRVRPTADPGSRSSSSIPRPGVYSADAPTSSASLPRPVPPPPPADRGSGPKQMERVPSSSSQGVPRDAPSGPVRSGTPLPARPQHPAVTPPSSHHGKAAGKLPMSDVGRFGADALKPVALPAAAPPPAAEESPAPEPAAPPPAAPPPVRNQMPASLETTPLPIPDPVPEPPSQAGDLLNQWLEESSRRLRGG